MADEVLDTVEQGERARQWMQRNGSSIIMGTLTAIAVLYGYNAWQSNQSRARGELGDRHQELIEAVAAKELDRAKALVARLVDSGDKTAYAALALMQQAGLEAGQGKLPDAIATLDKASQLSNSEVLTNLILLRRARLMIAEGKASDALAVLSSVKHYEAETKELKGDALVQNEKFDEARAAYKEALAATSVGAANRAFLEQKLEDLGS